MEKRGPTVGSGTYGQACLQCFKAKCRCVARAEGGPCERCSRLKKQCQPSNSVRRRAPQNGQAGAAEIAKLEDRINTLTTMLQSAMEKTGVSSDAQLTKALSTGSQSAESQPTPSDLPGRSDTAGATDSSGATTGRSDAASISFGSDGETGSAPLPAPLPIRTPFHTPLAARPHDALPPHTQGSLCPALPSDASSQLPLYELSLEEAEWYVCRFRTHMLPHFPFIILAPGTTARQLCRDRPLLLQAIISVATPSSRQKAVRAERLKKILTRCAVIENQSSIDVLLSILTYITWSTDPFVQPANNLSRMTMLAISLVYDLQLASLAPPAPDARFIAIMTPGFERPGGSVVGDGDSGDSGGDGDGGVSVSLNGALERQRAFLACFVLSSIVSASFGRMVALRWTAQMENGLQLIETAKLCRSDGDFAVQVRLQVFIQRAALVREQQEADRALATTAATTPVSTNLYVKMLQGQLKELRDSLSPCLQRRDMLLVYTHYAELCLNEVTRLASSEAPVAPALPRSPGNGSGHHHHHSLPALEHIECLWRSVYAIKAWLDAYRAIPPSAYVGVPFFFWFQFVRCIVILKHLATFKDPAWDCQAVSNAVDMSNMLEWMAVKTELASKEAGEQSDDDLFRRVSSMLRSSQGWMRAKERAASNAAQGATSLDSNGNGNQSGDGDSARLGPGTPGDLPVVPDDAWMGSIDMGEDTWIEDLFGWPMAAI